MVTKNLALAISDSDQVPHSHCSADKIIIIIIYKGLEKNFIITGHKVIYMYII